MTLAPPLYGELTSFFLPKALILDDYVFGPSDEPLLAPLRELAQRAKDGWRIAPHDQPMTSRVRDLVRGHLDGMLIGPAMVALARRDVLGRLEGGPVRVEALPGNAASLTCLFELLSIPGWIERTEQGVQLTGRGRYAAQIAARTASPCRTCQCSPSCPRCCSATRAFRGSTRAGSKPP